MDPCVKGNLGNSVAVVGGLRPRYCTIAALFAGLVRGPTLLSLGNDEKKESLKRNKKKYITTNKKMQLSSNSRSMMSKMLLVLSLVAAAMAATDAPSASPTQEPSTTPIKAYRAVVIVIVVSCVVGVGMFVMLTIIVAVKRGNACSEHGPCANCCGEQQGAYRYSVDWGHFVVLTGHRRSLYLSPSFLPSFPSSRHFDSHPTYQRTTIDQQQH